MRIKITLEVELSKLKVTAGCSSWTTTLKCNEQQTQLYCLLLVANLCMAAHAGPASPPWSCHSSAGQSRGTTDHHSTGVQGPSHVSHKFTGYA